MNDQNDKSDLSRNAWAAMVKTLMAPCTTIAAHPPQKKCKGPRLRQLEHDVRDICQRNPQGSQTTQIDRKRTLLLCARQLFQQGVRRKCAVNLNANHVRTLVDAWFAEKLTAATIRNRLHYLRWLARKIGKPQIVAQANRAYGAGRGDK